MNQPAAPSPGKPWITANQVTAARIALLPVPCALLLYGGTQGSWIALVLYTILGMTDWVDGRLARKYGPTVLGGLLDPVADKVFIAAIIMPLNSLNMVDPLVVLAILFREYLITGLRSVMSLHGRAVKTSILAKLKTAIQMVGVGFIFLIDQLRDTRVILTTLGVLSAGAVAVMTWRRVVTGRFSPLVAAPSLLIVLALIVRSVFEPENAIDVHWGVVLLFTWASAVDYLSGAGDVLRKGGRVHGLGRLAWALAAGVAAPWVMAFHPEITPLWVLLMASELTSGAVDNLRCHSGEPPRTWVYPLRALGLVLGAAAVNALPAGQALGASFWVAGVVTLAMSAWTVVDLYAARGLIWGDAKPSGSDE